MVAGCRDGDEQIDLRNIKEEEEGKEREVSRKPGFYVALFIEIGWLDKNKVWGTIKLSLGL